MECNQTETSTDASTTRPEGSNGDDEIPANVISDEDRNPPPAPLGHELGAPLEAVVVTNRGGPTALEEEARHRILDNAPLIEDSCVVPVVNRPDVDSLPESKDGPSEDAYNRIPCAIIGGILIIVAASVAVALGVSLGRKPSLPPPQLPTQPPTQSDTKPPALQHTPPQPTCSLPHPSERFALFKSVVLKVQLSKNDAFNNACTPQYKALDWLANNDTYVESSPAGDSFEALIQRYVLAVLYFATGGPTTWAARLNFLEPTHECLWWDIVPHPYPDIFPNEELDMGVACDEELQITEIHLLNNGLTQTIPKEIGELDHLRELRLGSNRLIGTIPTELYQLRELQALWLEANHLNGTISPMIGKLQAPLLLMLDHNSISGTLPESLVSMPNLLTLTMNSNALTGTIPEAIKDASNLRLIGLGRNMLTGHLPDGVFHPYLTILHMSGNNLSGTIPESIGVSTDMEGISFDNNALSGTIPNSITNLTSLKILDLSWNSLNGTIPSLIGNLDKLEQLNLGPNLLSGTIPQSMQRLVHLTSLNLAGNMGRNRLSGTVPSFIGEFAGLESLILNQNHFFGTLPQSLRNLKNLVSLTLELNDLTGDLGFLCDTGINEIFAGDCGGISPEIICTCCHICCDKNDFCDFA